MARISSYTHDENVQKADKLIGSDVDGKTRNYSIANISQYLRETNATGAVGYFPFKLSTSTPTSGEVKGTFSSGLTFANLTSIKMNKYIYKDTDNAMNVALRVLNQRDVLIVDVNDHNNYGIYGVGSVTQDGSSDNYEYDRRIQKSIAFERKFLQAENELVQINKLTESPKNDTVRAYMKMNDKIAEGMVA